MQQKPFARSDDHAVGACCHIVVWHIHAGRQCPYVSDLRLSAHAFGHHLQAVFPCAQRVFVGVGATLQRDGVVARFLQSLGECQCCGVVGLGHGLPVAVGHQPVACLVHRVEISHPDAVARVQDASGQYDVVAHGSLARFQIFRPGDSAFLAHVERECRHPEAHAG